MMPSSSWSFPSAGLRFYTHLYANTSWVSTCAYVEEPSPVEDAAVEVDRQEEVEDPPGPIPIPGEGVAMQAPLNKAGARRLSAEELPKYLIPINPKPLNSNP